MSLVPNFPTVNKGLFYINGLNLGWLTGTTMTVAAGQCRDSTNINDINVTAGVTINAAVNGANGLDVGALANNTFYAVYAIGSSTANDPSVVTDQFGGGTFVPGVGLLSKSFTAPILPQGFDMFRRIGVVLTSGAAAILDFTQRGNSSQRSMWYGATIASAITAGADTAFTAVDCGTTKSLPSVATEAYAEAVLTADAGATRTAAFRAHGSSSVAGQVFMSSPASTVTTASLIIPCIGVPATAFDYLVSNNAAAIAINISGYLDQL